MQKDAESEINISPDNLLSEEDYELLDEEQLKEEAIAQWNETAPETFKGMLETESKTKNEQ